MPGRTTNGIARPAAMPETSTTPTTGTWIYPRATQPPGRIERAPAKAIRFMEQTEILGQFRIES
ncbi:hypothetical protein LZ30DRAFT_739956 [Colletotrichum cereale]|nr:hypothetical protein LZ30DRAFT_739956 [Colletotrichum cereale]